jgi:hypothetical protein
MNDIAGLVQKFCVKRGAEWAFSPDAEARPACFVSAGFVGRTFPWLATKILRNADSNSSSKRLQGF